MPRCDENTYDTTHATANRTNPSAPNSSAPITVQAIGTLAAPANTATSPTAAISVRVDAEQPPERDAEGGADDEQRRHLAALEARARASPR